MVKPGEPQQDRGIIMTYLQSGFPPVLGIKRLEAGDGHAVCAVGVKLAAPQPQTDSTLHHVDLGSRLVGLFIHDDRLGPYAIADVVPYTVDGGDETAIRTALWIKWPDKVEEEHSLLTAIIVPVPVKLRLRAARMREHALGLADAAGAVLAEAEGTAAFDCRYVRSTDYRTAAAMYPLTAAGRTTIACELVLSRYVGVVTVSRMDGIALFDAVLDTTETDSNPPYLALVRRAGLEDTSRGKMEQISRLIHAKLVW